MTKKADQEQYHVEKLYEEYQPRLKNYINKHVDNESDTEDILQDIFYQLIKTVENIGFIRWRGTLLSIKGIKGRKRSWLCIKKIKVPIVF